MPGEALLLADSGALMPWIQGDTTGPTRIARGEAHPTGPLWGKGPLMSKGACRALEESVLAEWDGWRRGLEAAGLRQDRRSLRLPVHDLAWRRVGQDGLEVGFTLPAGSFATAVLRELVDARDAVPDGTGIASS
jgi:tRNA pseudouridine13 synthase